MFKLFGNNDNSIYSIAIRTKILAKCIHQITDVELLLTSIFI